VIRPGPERIAPGTAPGGVVMHVYRLSGGLILERRIPALATCDAAVEDAATADALRAAQVTAAGEPIIIVSYDGDDGMRYTVADAVEAGLDVNADTGELRP
jgi:hypothetical protein